ncbi:hypothetical protein [Stenotrophomonas acidaminiphila]|uniref:hypothetical protein n=1 Tax=Stenotrophomonas acidaminiphila TaxID=128780 RepID=UPI003D08ABF8
MKRITMGLGVLLAALAAPAAAMTFMKVDYVCPIGGERFSASTMGSGTSFGHFLDGRAHGAIQSPWPLVECPGNGFLLFREAFDKTELEALGTYVQSADYQRLRGTETSYWRLAQLLRVIGAPAAEQAGALQRASWQASPAQYPRYVAAASAAFARQCPDGQAARDGQWLYCQMLLGEWERRLSRFEPARARFNGLLPQVQALVTGPDRERVARQFAAEIAQQLQLIDAGDSRSTMAVDANAPAAAAAGPAPGSVEDAASAADASAAPVGMAAATTADVAAMAAAAAAEAAREADADARAGEGDR